MTDQAKLSTNPVRRWTFILLGVALLLTLIYLRADRVTPYTTQARVHALVVPIAAQVSGTISSVEVSNNQVVSAGQVLFRLDDASYQLAVQNAEANLQAARQTVGASSAGVDAARAQLESARANALRAQQDADRQRRIREQDPGAISERRIEMAEASQASAEAAVQAAEANVQQAIENLGETDDSNSRIQQATAALNEARLNLERTEVRAPEDGVVTDVRLDRGNFAGAGAPQMTFIGVDNIWVQADYTENNLGHIRQGDRVEMIFDALPGTIIKGTVREAGFGVAVDQASLGTLPSIQNDRQWLRDAQRFPVLIDFELDNPELRENLRVGSQVSVITYTGRHWIMNPLGWIYIRVASLLNYAY